MPKKNVTWRENNEIIDTNNYINEIEDLFKKFKKIDKKDDKNNTFKESESINIDRITNIEHFLQRALNDKT